MHTFSKEALAAAADDEACAVKTFSAKTSDDNGGREATRRLRLYRLVYELALGIPPNIRRGVLLPVTSHMPSLEIAISERHLARVARKRVCLGGI